MATLCGEVFDMHGPDEVFVHVPHITEAERARFYDPAKAR
jgi:hypothetical protein